MNIEEIVCYLHTVDDDSYGFFAIIDDNIVQNRKSNRKNNPFCMPCDNIKINTLFIWRVETSPGKMKNSCYEAPLDIYLKIFNDEKMMKILKKNKDICLKQLLKHKRAT